MAITELSNLACSGLGYMVSSMAAYHTGDWRWGLRITPLLNWATIVLMVFFCSDPPRGESDFEATEGRKNKVEVKVRICTAL